jgi:hypothetical protein
MLDSSEETPSLQVAGNNQIPPPMSFCMHGLPSRPVDKSQAVLRSCLVETWPKNERRFREVKPSVSTFAETQAPSNKAQQTRLPDVRYIVRLTLCLDYSLAGATQHAYLKTWLKVAFSSCDFVPPSARRHHFKKKEGRIALWNRDCGRTSLWSLHPGFVRDQM